MVETAVEKVVRGVREEGGGVTRRPGASSRGGIGRGGWGLG